MSKVILVVGATGNTGRGVVETLSKKLSSNSSPAYTILALTRDRNGRESTKQSELPHVKVEEKNYLNIDAQWLKDHQVARVYLAAQNTPSQFTEESNFIRASREAGVEHLVVLSTLPHFIGPYSEITYGRAHWAKETQLQHPSTQPLHFTVIRANYFTTTFLDFVIHQVKNGESKIPFLFNEDAKVAVVNPYDVGVAAGTLLSLDSQTLLQHHEKIYNVSGPLDETGRSIVGYIQKYSDTKFTPEFNSIGHLKSYIEGQEEYVVKSIQKSLEVLRSGIARLETTPTSPEVLKLVGSLLTVEEYIKQALSSK